MNIDLQTLSGYSSFTAEVTTAYQGIILNNQYDEDRVHHLLNGGASSALHDLVGRSTRTKYGIFFSGMRLAAFAASLIQEKLQQGASIGDPACGAGDLLLAALTTVPCQTDLETTLLSWGKSTIGLDIHGQMASAARHRIGLLAASRVLNSGYKLNPHLMDVTGYLPNIRSGNYFSNLNQFRSADCILMNPPFTETDSPADCAWSTGKVQQAAVFTASIVGSAKNGQEIVAILPDVLRSGTRYERWRQLINDSCEILNMNIFGRFDPRTDVDVFVLHLKKRSTHQGTAPYNWQNATDNNQLNARKISDLFKVSVGAVVPHRHKNKGPWASYIEVATVPPNSELMTFKKRRFTGTLHAGPFVVIRRTSSPSDAQRAIPSLINTTEKVAVENHFIVLQPHDGRIETCRMIIETLNNERVNTWLNTTIRCRHLTTKAVQEIPLG